MSFWNDPQRDLKPGGLSPITQGPALLTRASLLRAPPASALEHQAPSPRPGLPSTCSQGRPGASQMTTRMVRERASEQVCAEPVIFVPVFHLNYDFNFFPHVGCTEQTHFYVVENTRPVTDGKARGSGMLGSRRAGKGRPQGPFSAR